MASSAAAAPAGTGFALGLRTQPRELEVSGLPVEGRLPDWLDGRLYRNGPAQFEVGPRPLRHWFDGFAMVHRLALGAGRVDYRNRFVRSRSWLRSMERGRLHDMQFGSNVSDRWARNVGAFLGGRATVTDNTSVNLVPAARGELLALTESAAQLRIDADSLETLGAARYGDALRPTIVSAHPHHDAARGETLSHATRLGRRSEYLLYRQADGSATREAVARIPAPRPAYLHSFALSRHYAVLLECPLRLDTLALLFSGKAFIDNFRWEPQRASVLHVVDRRDGRVRRFETEPMFVFHHVNAWEAGGELVLDFCAYPDAGIVGRFALEALRAADTAHALGRLRRCRIDLAAGSLRLETLCAEPLEFPTIDYRGCSMRAHRHVYGVSGGAPGVAWNRLIKIDAASGRSWHWQQAQCYPGEPLFVRRPGAGDDDRGAVLSVVLDAAAGSSFLLVLDAQSFQELGRARLPQVVPHGFHGLYLDAS